MKNPTIKSFKIGQFTFDLATLLNLKAIFMLLNIPKVLEIIKALSENDYRVVDLQNKVGLQQSPCSQYLSKLKRLKLVDTRRDGKYIVYSLGKGTYNKILVIKARLKSIPYETFRAICQQERIDIIQYIAENPNSSTQEIYKAMDLEQAIVSKHTQILKRAGFLKKERVSKKILSEVNYDFLKMFKNAVTEFYSEEAVFVQ